MDKQTIISNLNTWIRQRPGLEYGNYGDIRAYRSELRGITKDYQDARQLLAFIAMCDSITASDIIKASESAFAGRLSINPVTGKITYVTGQYWPTEYRAAVCAVLASTIWHWLRASGYDTGDKIRKAARAEFGRGNAARWFR